MSKLKIHKNKKNFTLDGKHFFYLADTVWSAFTNATIEEWEFYLEQRYREGFNVLQINTLPQWDRGTSDLNCYPFETKDGETFDFSKGKEEYYIRAKYMCQMAVDKGFQLALVVLWLNYVPGTWGSKMFSGNIMPKEMIGEYAAKIVTEFEEFDPIYVISGDTDFDTIEAIEYYKIALDTICEMSPDSLKTMHIKRGYDKIPVEFLNKLSFYMFQSGHNADGQDMAYRLPEAFLRKYPRKPLINAEPCYEQMGYSRQVYGRFHSYDIRKAAYSSILSGASAGVTYGAHGVWNWKKCNKRSTSLLGEGFDEAFPMQQALLFPGAWDYGYLKHFFEMNHIWDLEPARELIKDKSEEVRMAKTEDNRYLIYMPYATKIVLNQELTGYQGRAVDLSNRNISNIILNIKEGTTEITMHTFENDVLLYLAREE